LSDAIIPTSLRIRAIPGGVIEAPRYACATQLTRQFASKLQASGGARQTIRHRPADSLSPAGRQAPEPEAILKAACDSVAAVPTRGRLGTCVRREPVTAIAFVATPDPRWLYLGSVLVILDTVVVMLARLIPMGRHYRDNRQRELDVSPMSGVAVAATGGAAAEVTANVVTSRSAARHGHVPGKVRPWGLTTGESA
jgi:hypothetical protein